MHGPLSDKSREHILRFCSIPTVAIPRQQLQIVAALYDLSIFLGFFRHSGMSLEAQIH
jgi:hypothetical protein